MLPIGNCNDIQDFSALHSNGSVSTLNLDTSNHNGLGLLFSKRFECHAVYQERRRGRKFFRLPRARQSCSGLFHAGQGPTPFHLLALRPWWRPETSAGRRTWIRIQLRVGSVPGSAAYCALAAGHSYVSVDAADLENRGRRRVASQVL